MIRDRIPLRPAYSAARARPGSSFVRAAVATLMSYTATSLDPRDAHEIARRNWPHDKGIELLTKPRPPRRRWTSADWAGVVTGMGVSYFIQSIGPTSAGAALLSRGIQFKFDNTGAISFLCSFWSNPRSVRERL